jgi:hypothetical protein
VKRFPSARKKTGGKRAARTKAARDAARIKRDARVRAAADEMKRKVLPLLSALNVAPASPPAN